MIKPRTRRQLWAFIGAAYNIWLPFNVYTQGHSCPFDFIADGFFNSSKDIAAWSSRSGIKTLSASILASLEHIFTDNLQSRVLAGSEDQAKYMYEYWLNWCVGPMRHRLSGHNMTRLMTHIGGGRMEILAASQKKVRGAKIQRLYNDEYDEIDTEIIAASGGMLASRNEIPARTVYTSTWHRVNGPMGGLVNGSPENGVKIHKWNIWESIAQCPEERHQNGSGCNFCPMAVDCVAKAQEYHNDPDRTLGIAADARGLYQVDDAIKIWQKCSRPIVDAEYLCNRPSPDGLVYADFCETVNVRNDSPDELKIYRAIDWGYNVFVCLWIGVDKYDNAWLVDTYKGEQGITKQHADYLNNHHIKQIMANYCDPAGRSKNDQTGKSDVAVLGEHGINCTYTTDRYKVEVANGIRLVQSFIKTAEGKPRFFVINTPANRAFINDICGYVNRKVNGQYIDDPIKPQPCDHTMDALRYFFINRFEIPSVHTTVNIQVA